MTRDVDRHEIDPDNRVVPVDADSEKNVPGSPGAASVPDWEDVPFEVGCARCGRDLRGLEEPVCPQCGLDFDWSDAVPIEQLTCLSCGYHLYGLRETRCPECGEWFHWGEVPWGVGGQ